MASFEKLYPFWTDHMKLPSFTRSFVVLALISSLSAAVLAQADVPRRTTAITYPLDETVKVEFRGTTRFPRMKGEAKVRRTARTGTRIELSVEKMPRPFELGPGYATYVVWAISPEGQVDNLGEIKRSGLFFIDSKVNVTTTFQTFSIIVTAEPHFLVTRPSQQIMLENLYPVETRGKRIATVPAVQYFGNSSDYFRDPRTPEIAETDYARTPPAILQARQAVALAKFAGAERDAPDELREAETLLQNADNAWQAGRAADTVDVTARRAISAAVKAEEMAAQRKVARERRNEQLRNDAEIREAENRVVDALGQIVELRAELARETRNRELAERDSANYANQVRELREENGRLREELGRVRVEIETARARITALENENRAKQEESDRELRAANIRAAEPGLMQQLRSFGTVQKNERGIVLTLPETFWTNTRSTTLTPQADGRLNQLGAILASNPDYRIAVESHTDNTGDPAAIQTLTDRRSYLIADKIASQGVDDGRLMAKGFGASVPVAPNTTAANKAKNRRVQIVLSVFQGS
jgi:outer membrane protein OmpA-like peptidoglycan-associated protein